MIVGEIFLWVVGVGWFLALLFFLVEICFEQHYFYHDVIWQMIVNNGY